jgi:hypothetical protein
MLGEWGAAPEPGRRRAAKIRQVGQILIRWLPRITAARVPIIGSTLENSIEK